MCVYVHVYSLSLGLQEQYTEEMGNPGLRDGWDSDGERGAEAEVGLQGEQPGIDELDPPKVLGDLLESVAGAIFVDSKMSLSAVWRVFQPLFQEKIGQWYYTHTWFLH